MASREISSQIIKECVEGYIGLLSVFDKNYHKFTYKKTEFKFEFVNFRTYTEQRDSIIGDEFGRENIKIERFDFDADYDAFLDIGAHFGVYSVVVGLLNPNMTIHSFEPTRYNYDILKRNIGRNNLEKKVFPHQKVVSNVSGTIDFYQDTNFEGSTRDTLIPPDSANEFEKSELQSVKASDFLSENEYEKVFLKIDAEGAEDAIVEDILENFEGQVNGLLEIHSDRLENSGRNILNSLDASGYNIECVKKHPKTNRAYIFDKI